MAKNKLPMPIEMREELIQNAQELVVKLSRESTDLARRMTDNLGEIWGTLVVGERTGETVIEYDANDVYAERMAG